MAKFKLPRRSLHERMVGKLLWGRPVEDYPCYVITVYDNNFRFYTATQRRNRILGPIVAQRFAPYAGTAWEYFERFRRKYHCSVPRRNELIHYSRMWRTHRYFSMQFDNYTITMEDCTDRRRKRHNTKSRKH